MEERLIVGIDISEEKDKCCMTIVRKTGRGMHIINQLFDKEAEDIYYKLINKTVRATFPELKKVGINCGMLELINMYSYKELLEVIDVTIKLKQYADKEREYILKYNTPGKIREILTVFWLTHTNDEFFNYFGFNWVPPVELQKEAKKIINKQSESQVDAILNIIPPLKVDDFSSVIKPDEVLKKINRDIEISLGIDSKIFMGSAANESE